MMERDCRHFTWALLSAMLLVGLLACDNGVQKAAPIGDHAGLEQLAAAYRQMLEKYPAHPAGMPPAGKKEFIERVFSTAGYSYSATLKTFAKQGVNVTSQDQRDLAELLFLPLKGVAEKELNTLYAADELDAVRSLQAGLK